MEKKNFDPIDTKYGLLNKISSKQIIPSLQRPYTWDEKNINKFWKDILENDAPYFIGTIVLVAGKGSISRDEVIDGQQRLTTLSLILIALRDFLLVKNSDSPILDEIKSLLLEPVFDGEPQVRLKFTNEMSNAIYTQLVNKKGIIQKSNDDIVKKFLENYEEIVNLLNDSVLIKKEISAEGVFEKIQNLELINITCHAKNYGYKLFESLNATAESLAGVDLIKNSIFMILSQNLKTLKEGEEKWAILESKFSESRSLFRTFIRHQWLSRYGYVSHGNLFEAFEKRFFGNKKNIKDISAYLDLLIKDADIYMALRNSKVDFLTNLNYVRFDMKEVERVLQFLSFLNLDQVYPILLYIYNNEPKNFKKYLIKLVSFQFIFKHIPGSPSEVEKNFARFCSKKINNVELFNSLEKICHNQEKQFKESLLLKIKYTKLNGDVQFVLEQFMYHYGPGQSHSKPTIEHIIPQKPTTEYRKELIGKFNSDPLLMKLKISELGNLTLLEKNINSSDTNGNLAFKDKVSNYKNTHFVCNDEIMNFPFEKDPLMAINDRGMLMASDVYSIFMNSLRTGKLINKKNEKNK